MDLLLNYSTSTTFLLETETERDPLEISLYVHGMTEASELFSGWPRETE